LQNEEYGGRGMPTFSQYPRDDRVDVAQEIALGDPSDE
jgi:hypothetical protein